jgi:hypothetical protein
VRWGSIQQERARLELSNALSPLIGVEIGYLKLPPEAARELEPSQVGTIAGTLADAMLAHIVCTTPVGLRTGFASTLESRDGYPALLHEAGYRVELRGLFCDNPSVSLKKPCTKREPAARLGQKVTLQNVAPDTDALLILSYHLHPSSEGGRLLTPVIRGLGIFPLIDCVKARDFQLAERGELDEGTHMGKLELIPYKPLQEFLAKNGACFAVRGQYPVPWAISGYEDTDSTSMR